MVDSELIGPRNGVVGINDRVAWEDADTLVAPGAELEPDRISLGLAAT